MKLIKFRQITPNPFPNRDIYVNPEHVAYALVVRETVDPYTTLVLAGVNEDHETSIDVDGDLEHVVLSLTAP